MSSKLYLLSILIFITAQTAFATNLDVAKVRCSLTTPGESFVYQNDFQNPALHLDSTWWWTLPEMNQNFHQIYNSGKRLSLRAYYDPHTDQFLLPLKEDPTVVATVTAPAFFIESVRQHIESALKNKYAEYIYFPDMGHSHFYFDDSHWSQNYTGVTDKATLYNLMLADPELKMLYHTAEKLLTTDEHGDLLPDVHLQFRYTNRNILGDNKMTEALEVHFPQTPNSGNTVGSIPHHHLYSAGYYIHSSKEGCFSYTHQGETYYFDISLHDPGYDPDLQTVDYW